MKSAKPTGAPVEKKQPAPCQSGSREEGAGEGGAACDSRLRGRGRSGLAGFSGSETQSSLRSGRPTLGLTAAAKSGAISRLPERWPSESAAH